MNLIRFTGYLFLFLALSGGLQAGPSETPESPQLYDVELIIFAQPGQPGEEQFKRSPELPDSSRWIDLEQSAQPEGFENLQPSALTTEASRLERGNYQVLVHRAWRQPGIDRSSAPAVILQSSARAINGNPLLDGAVSVGLSRYLHASFDLLLRSPLVGEDATTPTDSLFGSEIPARVQIHRRMRSGELHYLDNPRIGILIRIDKYEPPQPEVSVPDLAPPVSVEPATPESPAKPAPAPVANEVPAAR